MPPCSDSPISQVLLVEKPSSHPAGRFFLSDASADRFNSGYVNPLSPAQPQHPTSSGTMTVSAHSDATYRKSEPSPSFVDEQVVWMATVPDIL